MHLFGHNEKNIAFSWPGSPLNPAALRVRRSPITPGRKIPRAAALQRYSAHRGYCFGATPKSKRLPSAGLAQ
jgi:hypothetical protein